MAIVGPNDWVARAISDRGITRLCHFTSLTALERIITDRALLDRQTLEDGDEVVDFNDPFRHDGHRHHVCLTVQHPNVIMMDRLSANEHSQREFVVVCVRPSEMAREGVLFARLNAATNSGGLLAAGEDGFNQLYIQQPGPRPIYRSTAHAPSCPTDIQAEVLIPGPIPLSSALCIVTISTEIAGFVRRVLSSAGVELPVVAQPRFFNYSDITSAVWSGNVIELPGL